MTKRSKVMIPASLMDKLDALPNSIVGRKISWTADEDAALLKYWTKKRCADVAKILCRDECACRRRYRALVGVGK